MGTTLHTLAPNPGANKRKKRVGRGKASGTGKTAGRGTKGQRARAGHHGKKIGFEGGQMPLQMRLPKRGFKNPFRKEAFAVNLSTIAERFESGPVDIEGLRSKGVIPKNADLIKILGTGDLGKSYEIHAHRFSKSATAKIEAAGGKCVVITRSAKAEAEATPTA